MKTLLKNKRQQLVDWIKSKKKSSKKVADEKIDYEGIRLKREYYIDKDDETHLFI